MCSIQLVLIVALALPWKYEFLSLRLIKRSWNFVCQQRKEWKRRRLGLRHYYYSKHQSVVLQECTTLKLVQISLSMEHEQSFPANYWGNGVLRLKLLSLTWSSLSWVSAASLRACLRQMAQRKEQWPSRSLFWLRKSMGRRWSFEGFFFFFLIKTVSNCPCIPLK